MAIKTASARASTKGKNPPTKGEQLILEKLEIVSGVGGEAEFTKLCDVAELEHVCDVLRSAIEDGASGVLDAIDERLIRPLQRYAETLALPTKAQQERLKRGLSLGRRMETQPTADLLLALDEVRARVERGPWNHTSAEATVQKLSGAWFKWIAYVASHYLWHDVPKSAAKQHASREFGREGGSARKKGQQRLSERAAKILARRAVLIAGGMEERYIAARIAEEEGITAKWVREVTHRADATPTDCDARPVVKEANA
jgi:hypothetical protein